MKFGRTYRLNVQVSSGNNQQIAIVGGQAVPINPLIPGTSIASPVGGPLSQNRDALNIVYPITLNLDVQRSTLAQTNKGSFRIMNLNETSRRQIHHDRWDTTTYRNITLHAGYEGDPKLPIIFQGNIQQAQSYRQKQDWVTEIEALDGGFGVINGQVSTTVPAGYTLEAAIRSLIQTMPNVKVNAIGSLPPIEDQNSRGLTLMGNSWDSVNALAPSSNCFIDNEKVNVLGKNEYIASDTGAFIISSDTGLLETPKRGEKTLELKMLFEPRIYVGQYVQVLSTVKYYNGVYAVQGVSHQGIISGAVGGELTTRVTVFTGTELLRGVTPRNLS